jgi:putative spermidine/putrescine transport system permease protein
MSSQDTAAAGGFAPAALDRDEAAALRRRLRRSQRRARLRALALVAPLLLFLALTFLVPLVGMLWRAAADPELSSAMPRTAALLRQWDGTGVPPDSVFAAAAEELAAAGQSNAAALVAKRLNYEEPGYRTLLLKTANWLAPPFAPSAKAAMVAVDRRWGDPAIWAAMRRASGPFTSFYLLAALDLEHGPQGIVAVSPDRAVFRMVLWRTLSIALGTTIACLILGFPVALLLARTPPGRAGLLMLLVLLPFWTPLLVRIAAWIVLLQEHGVINNALTGLGLASHPLSLLYNRTAVYVAMTHVLLPYMILPLYSVMRGIPPSYMRAASSLGAPPWAAFRRVYLPQCLPGIGAGCLLVFILAIGYYITPALVGGAADQMVSSQIAFYTISTGNWGMAAALSAVLLVATLILYAFYARLVGAERLRMG